MVYSESQCQRVKSRTCSHSYLTVSVKNMKRFFPSYVKQQAGTWIPPHTPSTGSHTISGHSSQSLNPYSSYQEATGMTFHSLHWESIKAQISMTGTVHSKPLQKRQAMISNTAGHISIVMERNWKSSMERRVEESRGY